MALPRESQVPEIRRITQVPSRPARSSEPPVLRLVRPSQSAVERSFSGLKGPAPGTYRPGPAILAPGSRVGILCDTLHGDPEIGLDYQQGLQTAAELIRELGFEPVVDRAHAAVAPYFDRWAGTLEERVQHFVRLIEDYRVDAVFPLFGKGGCHGVVDALADTDYRPSRPVVLLGGFSHHSDWALFAQSPRGKGFFSHTLSATQCAYWKMLPRQNVDNLVAVLHGAESVRYEGLAPLTPGLRELPETINGVLTGGNLSAILFNAAKPWSPSFRGRIVLCEDYDRHAHDVHRTFSAFARLAEQSGAAAIVVSAMLPMKRAAHVRLPPEDKKRAIARDRAEIAAILQEVAGRTRVPIFSHAGIASHGAMNFPLGMGGLSRLSPAPDGTYILTNQLKVWS